MRRIVPHSAWEECSSPPLQAVLWPRSEGPIRFASVREDSNPCPVDEQPCHTSRLEPLAYPHPPPLSHPPSSLRDAMRAAATHGVELRSLTSLSPSQAGLTIATLCLPPATMRRQGVDNQERTVWGCDRPCCERHFVGFNNSGSMPSFSWGRGLKVVQLFLIKCLSLPCARLHYPRHEGEAFFE